MAPHPGTPGELLTEWTRALNETDLPALRRLYAERVQFYGTSLGRDQVLEQKRQALTAAPTFQQTVLDKPSIARSGEVTRVAFHKRSGPKDAQRDTLATLVLVNHPQLLIQEETDATTEKKFGVPSLPTGVPEDCSSATWQVVYSTAEAGRLHQQIHGNLRRFAADTQLSAGSLGPFAPTETGDGTYSLAIGVHHPDRFESYGWFTIHPDDKVTIDAWTLELSDAAVHPSSEAVRHFKRLCRGE